jgi:tRNA A-37 threonylcarbamoyl transferase component Bud32
MAEGLEGLLTGHTLVKRYKIEEVCGRGGFAVVYRATDTRLGRPVAVKVITLTAEDPEEREVLRQRLHREARAAASLPHHPHLVTVHDVGTDPELGLDFLVMELLQGENLSQALQRGKPPLPRALRILRDAAEGLAIGHRAGLVHRDVKPGNIFLAASHHDSDADAFRVCLLDYGIAQAIEDDQTVTRGMGANPLSPAFASPEQLRGDRDLSPATDVFSLGVVGYQLLTGERPFTTEPGQMPTGWTVRSPIHALAPEVPPAVEEVVMRAMSESPRDRYPDADAFAEALDAAVDGDPARGLAARVAAPAPGVLSLDEALEDDATMIAPAPPVRPASAPAEAAHRPVPPLRPPAEARARKGSRMPVVAVLALLLVAVAGWALMKGMGGGSDPSLGTVPVAGRDSAGAGTDGTSGAALDDGSAPAEADVPSRTGPDVDVPTSPVAGSGGAPSSSQPGTGAPSVSRPAPSTPSGQPSQPSQPSQPAGQPQRPPASQPQPQPNVPPAARPPAQPSRPPAAQPQRPTPPVQQPTQPQPQPQPQPQQPQPQQPEPPLLGRPIDPQPPAPPPSSTPAPRDTLFIPSPPGALR